MACPKSRKESKNHIIIYKNMYVFLQIYYVFINIYLPILILVIEYEYMETHSSTIFSRNSYMRNDQIAKDLIKAHLNSLNEDFYVIDNDKDEFTIDLFLMSKTTDKCIGYVECERAENWWEEAGEFIGRKPNKFCSERYVRIPGRKAHFLDGLDCYDKTIRTQRQLPHGKLPIIFATCNINGDIMMVNAEVVENYRHLKEEDNSWRGNSKSWFICVPLKEWTHYPKSKERRFQYDRRIVRVTT